MLLQEQSDGKQLPKLAVFHNLPSGGGIRVLGQLIPILRNSFEITVHCLEGSAVLDLPDGISKKVWEFSDGKRLCGFNKLVAPITLSSRLDSLKTVCRQVAENINDTADLVLVHNSMFIAAPPILNYLKIPSLYFCYEYPRHIYEPDIIKRTDNPFFHFLLSSLRSKEKEMDKKAVLSATRVVTFSTWMKNKLGGIYGIDASIVRPGIDIEFFSPPKVAQNDNPEKYVFSVGALWPYKGHDLVIDALALIPKDIRPGLIIVADRELPDYKKKLTNLANRLGVDISIQQNIDDNELRDLYRGAIATLCCQRSEPYGLIPLEAMACGCPVIAVREGGFIDNIWNGENGLLVDVSPSEISSALLNLLQDIALGDNISTKGLTFVSNERTISEAGERLSALLQKTLKNG